MLSGLRVISREEAKLELQHIERETSHRSQKHGKEKKRKKRKRERKTRLKRNSSLEDSERGSDSDASCSKILKSRRRKRKHYSDPSSSSDTSDNEEEAGNQGASPEEASRQIKELSAAARKAAGLEWMIQAPSPSTRILEQEVKRSPEDSYIDEKLHVNPKELNPFLKDGGDGYPSESKRPEAPIVGDGGLSWRLKALKRAKEQAEREGKRLDMVVEERWGSLAEMTVSVSAKRAAHAHAHLHAIRERKSSENLKPGERGTETSGVQENMDTDKDKDMERISMSSRDYLKDVHGGDRRMKAPRGTESLYWKRRKDGVGQSMRAEDKEIFNAAASALNQFQNDGNFLQNFRKTQQDEGRNTEEENTSPSCDDLRNGQRNMERLETSTATDLASITPSEGLSANQLAAKALQLQLQGKSKEAEELLNQLQDRRKKEEELSGSQEATRSKTFGETDKDPNTGYKQILKSVVGDYKRKLGQNESGDVGLAKSILHNKQYSRSTCVDEEYESVSGGFHDTECKRAKAKAHQTTGEREAKQAVQAHKRIITQEERCQFCFNNQSRPKHLTISIANSCYLMLPPWEPLVDGHCLLVPMQHEGSSRNMDEDVWEELRNYKKCLLQMFVKQGKDVLFMETAINLAQQRRHCLVECIPLPPDKAKQAPLYFKKAIDEAEDEWSQHDAKKLIDTSVKGLRGSIPKNFPYFHVEFGLRAGYVHVIDNEREFRRDFGRNVVIGMLKLPEEEMHRRRKQQTFDQQKEAALNFQKDWAPFDWTKMLD
ncbi:hypothetical protein GOP47_0018133 [Adiantum capillus-veneris]|nr:hypothetical protein GOP47_0018133 [Adiantum capillus-veneris]